MNDTLVLHTFIKKLKEHIELILAKNLVGIYIHGSIAMNCFNPKSSDVDLLVVCTDSIDKDTKRALAKTCLNLSNHPYPIEMSILNERELMNWRHPFPFEFHYSEFWREKMEQALKKDHFLMLTENEVDYDLAAHITILNHRGICLLGKPIDKVFPIIPHEHYLDSIFRDLEDCYVNIIEKPVYSILNMLRVYYYVTENVVLSKYEAGKKGIDQFNSQFQDTIQKALHLYSQSTQSEVSFELFELKQFRNNIKEKIENI